MEQPTLEGVDVPSTRKRKAGEPSEKPGIKWQRYRVQNPVHCDVCLEEAHKRRMSGNSHPAPNVASYRRSAAGVTTYLCWPHTVEQRERDGLAPIQPRRD